MTEYQKLTNSRVFLLTIWYRWQRKSV